MKKDFLSDAYAHRKFIGYVASAAPLLEAGGIDKKNDAGFIRLEKAAAPAFVKSCRALRYWPRAAERRRP